MKDITSDETLVEVVDEICHKMKAGIPHTDLRGNFKMLLDDFIRDNDLNTDSHHFASLPTDYCETVLGQKIFSKNSTLMSEICNKLDSMHDQVSVKGIRFKPDQSVEITVKINPVFAESNGRV